MADQLALQVNKLATELRSLKSNNHRADVKEQMEKMNDDLDHMERINSKIIAEKKALTQRVNDLEKSLMRPGAFGNDVKNAKSMELKAFEKFCVQGHPNDPHSRRSTMTAEELKYLRTDNNTEGGYLAPPEFVNEIIKKITEMTPIRQFARVRQTMREAIQIPTRTQLESAYWIGEGGDFINSQSSYGMEVLKVNKMGVLTIASTEMLADSAFDMDMEIRSDAIEAMSYLEGNTFVTGTGVNQPEGILVNPLVQTVTNNGNLTDIDFNALIFMRGQLKTGYNGAYFANRTTIANMRLQQDGVGRYLIDFFTQTGVPSTLLGDPLIEAPAVPSIDPLSNPYTVIYGDLGRGYNIVDGVQLAVIRDAYTAAAQGQVRFIWNRRVGGQVVLPEAILKLQMI